MLFGTIGRLVSRGWLAFLLGWIALVVATKYAAPAWETVAQDKEFAFLPEDAPSRRAEQVFAKAFPDDRYTSNIVLVLHREDTGARAIEEDLRFIENTLRPGLIKIADSEGGLASEPAPSDEPLFSSSPEPDKPTKKSIIAQIVTPNAPAGGAFLVSPDKKALLVVVDLTTEFMDAGNRPTIDKIEKLISDLRNQRKLPAGLDISLTGSAVVGRDHGDAQLQSVRATQFLTVALVIVLLIAIYRSPLLAAIPLATVYLAVQIAINVLAICAQHGHIQLFEGIEIYITILAYGAGVDYCLFLTARYKEELEKGNQPADAVALAVRDVGPALTASAAAVICGIGMMYFAKFGKFREAGLAIPLSLFIVLCAALTFSPALLRLSGRWAFASRSRGAPPAQKTEQRAAGDVVPSPGTGFLEGLWDRIGQRLLRRPGIIWLSTVVAMLPFVAIAAYSYHRLNYDLIGDLPPNKPSVVGTTILKQHFPAGVTGPVTVLMIDHDVDFGSDGGRKLISEVTDSLRANRQDLGLADVRTLTAPLGITAAAKSDPFAGLNLPEETVRKATARGALDYYVTDLGERKKSGTRLELILEQSPFSRFSVADLDRVESMVRDALPEDVRDSTQLYLTGLTPSLRDLMDVIRQDRQNIQLLVIASVFVILCLLLRRLWIPIYLLLSVLFSYFTALGVASLVFWLLDPHGFSGIDWKVAIFLFTILIAVGADYNIFLMTRIHEEERQHGPILAVTRALDRTGPVISSCGIIMAGTFASLLAGSLSDMKQLGFALAFGVLLDTFVVRPVLVPAFLIFWRSGRLQALLRPSRSESLQHQHSH
jgi:RND superfamily putative drug exporter